MKFAFLVLFSLSAFAISAAPEVSTTHADNTITQSDTGSADSGNTVAHSGLSHTSHSRVGLHGMVLFTDGEALFASHLPLYYSPHDYQLVYEVESLHNDALIEFLTSNHAGASFHKNTVTLLPAQFDLNKLVDGESFSVATQFFKGHFERGGSKWLHDDAFVFKKQRFKRHLAKQYKPSNEDSGYIEINTSQQWDKIALENAHLFIHHIAERPSFDALVIAKGCESVETGKNADAVPSAQALEAQFTHCDSHNLVYFETQDFAQ
ncbi:hypothetical protein [Alteromonas gracilis]|uniref:hypothetical protein n=1 Tax=Alteromonas gracilis TaxID=1479524 RepID=UPI003735D965